MSSVPDPVLTNQNDPNLDIESIKYIHTDNIKVANILQSKKNVRFPEGNGIILNCFEPSVPEPDTCSSIELVNHYIQGCIRYATSPSEFLLEQLKGIDLSVCNDRYSCLNLKGIKISATQMEALEEVFKRVHFKEIDLEDAYIDDQTTANLFDILLYYEACNDLILTTTFDKPNPRSAWSRCLYYMRRSCELRSITFVKTSFAKDHFIGLTFIGFRLDKLVFRDCSMSGYALQMLSRWLRALFSFGGIEFGSSVYKNLTSNKPDQINLIGAKNSKNSSKNTPSWRTSKLTQRYSLENGLWKFRFHLPENKLTQIDIELLFPLIRHCLLIPKVLSTYIPFNAFADHEIRIQEIPLIKDSNAFSAIGGNGYLYDLNLSQNYLKDDGVKQLCSGILMAYQAVRSRVQAEAHSWLTSHDGYSRVDAENMISHANPRELLDYARLDHVRLIERLNLASNSISYASMEALASVLCLSPTMHSRALLGGITHLDLSNNQGIGDRGLEILAEGLVRNQSLRVLHLRNVKMCFNGLFAICGFLTETYALEQLDIRSNSIQLDGIMALAKTIALNFSLSTLLMDRRLIKPSSPKDNNSGIQMPTSVLNGSAKEELESVFLEEIEACLVRNRAIPESDRGKPYANENRRIKDDSNLDQDMEKAEALLERSADVSTVGEDEEQAARDLEELLEAEFPEVHQISFTHCDGRMDQLNHTQIYNDDVQNNKKEHAIALEATEEMNSHTSLKSTSGEDS